MDNDFWKLYNHPKWQKRAAEIRERDGYVCQKCGADELILQVHHKYYDFSLYEAPWEYPDDALITLCECCHLGEKIEMKEEISELVRFLRKNFLSTEIKIVNNILRNNEGYRFYREDLVNAFRTILPYTNKKQVKNNG